MLSYNGTSLAWINKSEAGAEQVQVDWNATSGISSIANKPVLGTAATTSSGDYATAAQGAKADSAVQPGSLADVATTGSYDDLSDKPTLPDATTENKGIIQLDGDLEGSATEPTIKGSAVTSSKIADGAVSLAKIDTTGASTNQILSFNGTNAVWDDAASSASAGGMTAWASDTAYTVGQSVIAPTGDIVTPISDFTSTTTYDPLNWNVQVPVSNYMTDRLWRPDNILAVPSILQAATGTVTLNSGVAYMMGGPGCVIPKGRTANSISFLNNAASSGMTHTWFFLAVPDGSTNTAAVVATSVDNLTTSWPANTVLTLSLKTTDGGSGAFTPTTDTPVYIGVVQAGTTPATLRGVASSGFVAGLISTRPWWGSAGSGLTGPSSIAGSFSVNNAGAVPAACYVSE